MCIFLTIGICLHILSSQYHWKIYCVHKRLTLLVYTKGFLLSVLPFLFGLFVFYVISTFVDYLMPEPVHIYIYIYIICK